jgi:hypothetical protein
VGADIGLGVGIGVGVGPIVIAAAPKSANWHNVLNMPTVAANILLPLPVAVRKKFSKSASLFSHGFACVLNNGA